MSWVTKIYSGDDRLPANLLEGSFFHSKAFYDLARRTPRHRPMMVTVERGDGTVVAQMLALIRYHGSWVPPFLFPHCRIVGEGLYADPSQRDQLFKLMLTRLTRRLGRLMLYMEVSHLSHKMFAFDTFRQLQFFPVRWQNIHNSLHSKPPEERLSAAMKCKVKALEKRNLVTSEVADNADFKQFMRLLRRYNKLKVKRFMPSDEFFSQLSALPNAHLYLTRHAGKAVACALVVDSGGQAYLWYMASLRKSYVRLHPDTAVLWHVITDANRRGMAHVRFLDVGLPWRPNAFRDFILSFGGKPVGAYRWFRAPFDWLNSVMAWFYRD